VKKILLFLVLVTLLSCKNGQKSSVAKRDRKEKPKKEKVTAVESSIRKKTELVIKTARSYTGTPYKYGGTSRAGMDCSALTCASYKAAEIQLPRTANEQGNFGKTVSLNDLQKGDLVFFTDKKGHKKITHVGMVTEIKGTDSVKFIHASTKMGVVETELFTDYYKPIIIKAVRIF
jgi:probable lipoprotein NlpC